MLELNEDMKYTVYDKEYYIDAFQNLLKQIRQEVKDGQEPPVKRGGISRSRQIKLYDEIWTRYDENMNINNHFALDGEEIDEFFQLTEDLLQYIDDDIIMDRSVPHSKGLRLIYRNLLMCLKYHGDKKVLGRKFLIDKGTLYYEQRGIRYKLSGDQKVVLRAINIRNNKFCIDLRFMTELLYEYKSDAIYAELNGERFDVQHTEYYAHEKVFGRTIDRKYTFYVEFPLSQVLNFDGGDSEIAFFLEMDGERIKLPVDFNNPSSKIPNKHISTSAYWCLTNPGEERVRVAFYEDDTIKFRWMDRDSLDKREEAYLADALKSIKVGERQKIITALLKDRNILKALRYKRNINKEIEAITKVRQDCFMRVKEGNIPPIWMYFDKLTSGGDNGEYAFRYAYKNDDSIEVYYVINGDSPDYSRLKEEFGDHILTYGSHEAMLYALLAEVIVATHPDIMSFFGYNGVMRAVNKDLFNAYLVCIAHGITIQKNADYQNRLEDNTMFYTTSSKYEVEHLLHPVYGYKPEEIALTGMARFDGLVDEARKQVLITPTWRRNVVGVSERSLKREYNKGFKSTNYYKIYNSLINDERIIDAAKKYGYEILFLVHPGMASQKDDYEKNDFVKVVSASDISYEKVLRESSLMVTDYSGVHYDFGYMRKPVIYYQPKEVPMRFEEGGMKFKTMGFGPVCTEYDQAVELICEYMKQDCVMPEEFKRNADDFFAFNDHNNCSRIHEAIKTWVEEKKAK